MKFSLLLLFTLLSYPQTQARDSQLFNKVSPSDGGEATTVVPNQDPHLNNNQKEQEPSFFPQEKENGYGLYVQESSQLSHSATGAAAESEDHPNRHFPRNYNPVAYLTEPEEDENDNDSEDSYTTTLQNYYNDIRKSKQNQQEDEEISREPEQYRSSYNNNNNNQYRYSGGSSFNSDAAAGNSRENYLYNSGEESGFRPQGMSDTRSLENGKYFYDIKTEKYSRNHPYAVLNRAGANNNYNDQQSNYYGANDNSMSESFENQYEFQNEGN